MHVCLFFNRIHRSSRITFRSNEGKCPRMLCGILSTPHNIFMDLKNVCKMCSLLIVGWCLIFEGVGQSLWNMYLYDVCSLILTDPCANQCRGLIKTSKPLKTHLLAILTIVFSVMWSLYHYGAFSSDIFWNKFTSSLVLYYSNWASKVIYQRCGRQCCGKLMLGSMGVLEGATVASI